MTDLGHGRTRVPLMFVLRAGSSIVLLAGLAWWLDVGAIAGRLTQMHVDWVLAALALSGVQVLVSAWRWQFTAARLGVVLPFGDAVREYYLAMFVNQVVPGGVMGDVSRAWRHAAAQRRVSSAAGPAVRAVVLERVSGQLVMTGVAVASVLTILTGTGSIAWVVLAGEVALVLALRRWVPTAPPSGTSAWPVQLWRDAQAALLAGGVLPVQMASSAVVVGTYLATYVMAALAVGVDIPLSTLLPLVAPVLVAMLIPASVAGWGLREAAAALIWGAVGLTSESGVVVAVAYGLIVLLSSLPGLVLLVRGAARH